MTTTFDDIVGNLTASNFDTLRGYILDVVRAEYGPLISNLQDIDARSSQPIRTEIRSDDEQYSEGTGEPVETESTFSIADLFGGKPDRAKDRDQHLRFHALQSALAWLSIDGHEGEPVVLANLFYGFLKGDA